MKYNGIQWNTNGCKEVPGIRKNNEYEKRSMRTQYANNVCEKGLKIIVHLNFQYILWKNQKEFQNSHVRGHNPPIHKWHDHENSLIQEEV